MPISVGPNTAQPLALSLPRVEVAQNAPQTGVSHRSFGEQLESAIREVDKMNKTSDRLEDDYANGRQNDLHGTMIAMSEADISLRLVAQVRNKAIDAYREIMRMGA